MRAGDLEGARRQFDRVPAVDRKDRLLVRLCGPGQDPACAAGEGLCGGGCQARAFVGRFSASPLRLDVDRLRGRSLLDRQQDAAAVGVFEPLVAAVANNEAALEDRYQLALAYEGARRYKTDWRHWFRCSRRPMHR